MMNRKWMLKREEDLKRNDRKWHWIKLVTIIIGTGLFTLLGVWITTW